MLSNTFYGNPNIGFFRYSNNNKYNFINKNKLNANNPYIGYFSQYKNRKFNYVNNNLFSKFNENWLPYCKENPFIISKLIPHIGTNLILFDESYNVINKNNYFNFDYLNIFKVKSSLKNSPLVSSRESNDSPKLINKSTQTNISLNINTKNIEVQTDSLEVYTTYNKPFESYVDDESLISNDEDEYIFLENETIKN